MNGILAALIQAGHTGKGDVVDTALFEELGYDAANIEALKAAGITP